MVMNINAFKSSNILGERLGVQFGLFKKKQTVNLPEDRLEINPNDLNVKKKKNKKLGLFLRTLLIPAAVGYGSGSMFVKHILPPLNAFETECSTLDKDTREASIQNDDPERLNTPFAMRFRYFEKDKQGQCHEVLKSELLEEQEIMTREQLRVLFQHRPDLLAAFNDLKNPVEVMLFDTDYLHNDSLGQSDSYPVGITMPHKPQIALASTSLNKGVFVTGVDKNTKEVLDSEFMLLAPHEFIHMLDQLNQSDDGKSTLDQLDGLLPGWTEDQISQFKQAKTEEVQKILKGESLLRSYALANNLEFLASLAEVYLLQGKALSETSPVLYQFMNAYFKLDTAIQDPWPGIIRYVVEIDKSNAPKDNQYNEDDYKPEVKPDLDAIDFTQTPMRLILLRLGATLIVAVVSVDVATRVLKPRSKKSN